MLINTTEELKQFVPTSIGLDYEDIKPYLETAEIKIASDFLTVPILNFLEGTGLNPSEIKIKNLVTGSVALLALRSYLDFGQITVSSSGVHFTTNENTKTAFEWQITNLKKSCLIECYTKLELIYALIPDTTTGFKTLYENSALQVQINSLLLNSTREFSKHVSIGGSNVFFHKLINSITDAETFASDQLSPELFALLKSTSVPEAKQAAVEKIKFKTGRFCAFTAMANGMMENISILGEFGVQTINGTFARLSDSTVSSTEKMLEMLHSYYKNQAEKTLSELLLLCQKLSDTVTEYQNSENYLSETESLVARNNPDAPIVFL